MTAEQIKALAESVTTFIDQTKEVLHGVQTEIRELKTTAGTMANEIQA